MINKKMILLLMLSLGSGVTLFGNQLHDAVLAGDNAAAEVEKVFAAKKTGLFGGDLCDNSYFQEKDAQGKTALHLAVEKGLHEIVTLLLNKEKALNLPKMAIAINMSVEKDFSAQSPIDAAIALKDDKKIEKEVILNAIKNHIKDQQAKKYHAFFQNKMSAVLAQIEAALVEKGEEEVLELSDDEDDEVLVSLTLAPKVTSKSQVEVKKADEKVKASDKKEEKVVVNGEKVVDPANPSAPAPAPTPANPDPADPANDKSNDKDNAPKPDAAPMSMETKVMIGGGAIAISSFVYLCYQVYSDFEKLEKKNQEVKEEEQLSTSELMSLAMQKTWKRCASYFAL